MRILYIGDFEAFYSTENYVTYGLQQNGCTVIKLQEGKIRAPESVLGVAIEYKVDFVLLGKGNFPRSDETIALLRKHNFKTIGWIFDLYFSVPVFYGRRKLTNPAFKADLCCMTDGGHQKEWKENNVQHRLLRQGIHEPDAHYGKKTEGHPEVVFIGTHSYHQRVALVDSLRAAYGSNFRHYGRGGDVREIRGEALNDVLASAKVVVGDSMPSENYWSNRIYEITGRGGFLLHPRIEGLNTEFTDGEHFVGYNYGDNRMVKELVDRFLADDSAREKIRLAGHMHTKTNYTYKARCAKLLEYARSL